jgi:predicted RNase H-like nuclease (RuvC/YqgF family)
MDARILRNGAAFASLAFMTFAVTALPSLAQQQQQDSQQSTSDPVADAARKAREQKKKDTAKPKRVYTDDDVNHLVSGSAPASGDSDASSTTEEGAAKNPDAQGKGAQDKDAVGKTAEPKESPETKWRKQFKEAYANLDRAQRELDVLQREDNKAQVQYYSDPQKALAEQYTRKDINDKDTKIAAKKKEIDQLKQQISDMEEALRKSGGDPGWAAP